MKIIVSPTKKMKIDTDNFTVETQPQFLTQTKEILTTLQQLSYDSLKQLWKCSERIAHEQAKNLATMDLESQQTPAVMCYQGIQYQYLAPDILSHEGITYLKEHLFILSGFYGILRAFDGIVPYRLEMQAKLALKEQPDLYAFWGSRLYQVLDFPSGPVLNLASKEYSRAITPYLKEGEYLIDIVFAELIDGKPKVKATLAKMARGEMVRYLAENQIQTIEGVRNFNHPDYYYADDFSNDTRLVFLRNH